MLGSRGPDPISCWSRCRCGLPYLVVAEWFFLLFVFTFIQYAPFDNLFGFENIDSEPADAMESGLAVDVDKTKKAKEPMSWADIRAIGTLLVLYFLQGVPMGVCAAMPMIFQDANVSDSDQGKFSFASWPFSLKILWAPIVDAVFSLAIGRRKSWVVPSQFLIAVLLYISSVYIDDLLDPDTGTGIEITTITAIFFCLFFMCATQDIAVDGWALTMLSEQNVGYGSICNSIGQTLGNYGAYLIHAYGLATLPQAMRFWAFLFLGTTIIVLIFKPEKCPDIRAMEGVQHAYKGMWKILKLKHVQTLLVIMLLVKAPFVIVEGLSSLRLQAHGMPKSAIANIGLVTAPVGLLLPMFINPGKNVMSLFKRQFIPRLVIGATFPLVVYFAPAEWQDPFPYVRVFVGTQLCCLL